MLKHCVAAILLLSLSIAPVWGQSTIDEPLTVSWEEFQHAISSAASEDKKILIDIWAPWCGWCTRLQDEVYTDQKVLSFLNDHFRITRLNIDDSSTLLLFQDREMSPSELAFGMGATGTPTTVFLTSGSKYITRLPGFVKPGEFLTILQYIESEAYEKQTYLEFAKSLN